MRIDDVIFEYGAPGSRALGAANFTTMMNHLSGRRSSRDLRLDLGDDRIIEISDDDLDKIALYYNNLATTDLKKDFAYGVLSRGSRLIALLDKLEVQYTINRGEQAGLLEDQKKKEEPELSRYTVKDPKLSVALRKAYAKQPSAASDIEALIRSDIESQATTQDELDKQVSVNQRQQRNIETLRDLARKQSQLLKNLDSENSDQDREINHLEREIQDVAGRGVERADQPRYTKSSLRAPRADKEKDTAAEPTDSGSSVTSEPKKEPDTFDTKRAMPFEPTTGGAVSPRRPRGPGPTSGGGSNVIRLPYEPTGGKVTGTTGGPLVPSVPAATRPTIDLLPQVPDLDDRKTEKPRNSLALSPSPALEPDVDLAANDAEMPEMPLRYTAEQQDLDRLRTLSGIK